MEVAENVHEVVIGLPFKELQDIRIYYIDGERPAVIDSGPGYGVSDIIFPGLREMGLDIGDARMLLSTHEHPDHIGGHADMKRANSRIMIGAHAVAVQNYSGMRLPPEVMKDIPPNLIKKHSGQFEEVAAAGADFYLSDGDDVDLGDRRLKVLHLPGHAPGHVGFYDWKRKILFAGDNVTGAGTPYVGDFFMLDVSGERSSMAGGDMQAYLDSLDRIEALDIDIILPGHGNPCTKERVKEIRERKLEKLEEAYSIAKGGWLSIETIAQKLYHIVSSTGNLYLGTAAAYLKKLADDGRVEMAVENGKRYYRAVM